jgi:hypothetical protein
MESGAGGATVLIGVTAALGASAVAGASWAVIGYYVATTLSLGLILLPLSSGCGAGVLMRMGGGGFQRHVKWITVVATLVGCIVGDFGWIVWATQKPVGLLLGGELVMTMNTLFNLQKAVLYAVACYIAFSIAGPSRGFVSE